MADFAQEIGLAIEEMRSAALMQINPATWPIR
jgi:hypothetical protein